MFEDPGAGASRPDAQTPGIFVDPRDAPAPGADGFDVVLRRGVVIRIGVFVIGVFSSFIGKNPGRSC